MAEHRTSRFPDPPASGSAGGSASRLREAIDSGGTADKVPFPDPAAAPLGTDDEAAGTPPGATRTGAAHRSATAGATAPPAVDERGRPFDDRGVEFPGTSFSTAVMVLMGLIAVLAVAGVALFTA